MGGSYVKHAERRNQSAAFFLGIALWVVDPAIDAIYFSTSRSSIF